MHSGRVEANDHIADHNVVPWQNLVALDRTHREAGKIIVLAGIHAWHLGGLYIPVAKLIAFVVAMCLSGALWVFLHTTDLGKAMRAASQNRDVATLMGINPNRVFAVAFGAALALAGAAGSLLMPFYSAYPFVGQVFVLMAFVAVVLGTLGNVIGALIASLMMGVAESLGIQFVGADSGLIVVFAMLLLTLAFKPTGLGGGRVR